MDIQYDKSTKKLHDEERDLQPDGRHEPLYPDDPAVAPIVADAVRSPTCWATSSSAPTTADFGRAVLRTRSAPSFPENRGGESTLGNLVADVQRWSLNEDGTRNVDIAFMNPGGLRADLDAGEVTYREAANVQPFANTLVTLTLTRSADQDGAGGAVAARGRDATVPQARVQQGVDLHLRPDGRPGTHITEILLNGKPIDPTATYRSAPTRSSPRAVTTSSPSRRARARPTAARSTSSRWSTTSPPSRHSLARPRAARGRCAGLGAGCRRLRRRAIR